MVNIQEPHLTATQRESELALASEKINTPAFPEKVFANWRRFSNGLWRIPEGDISQAYCADTFPQLKAFREAGQLYATLGISDFHANCYPLLSIESQKIDSEPYSHEGEVGRFQNRKWRLGPQVKFIATDPTIEEWQNLLRVQYAEGGYFARQKSYSDFLNSFENIKTPNQNSALQREFGGALLMLSKTEMLQHLEKKKPTIESAIKQLELL